MNVTAMGPFNPAEMQQKHQQRFEQADVDQSGGLTLEEMQASAPEHVDSAKLEQRFAELDQNGDGEVTPEEHQKRMQEMRDKMGGMPATNSGGQGFSIDNLLQALTDDQEEGSEQKTQLEQMMEKLQAEGHSKETVSEALSLVSELVPAFKAQA